MDIRLVSAIHGMGGHMRGRDPKQDMQFIMKLHVLCKRMLQQHDTHTISMNYYNLKKIANVRENQFRTS